LAYKASVLNVQALAILSSLEVFMSGEKEMAKSVQQGDSGAILDLRGRVYKNRAQAEVPFINHAINNDGEEAGFFSKPIDSTKRAGWELLADVLDIGSSDPDIENKRDAVYSDVRKNFKQPDPSWYLLRDQGIPAWPKKGF
jgi:hypothetical protein